MKKVVHMIMMDENKDEYILCGSSNNYGSTHAGLVTCKKCIETEDHRKKDREQWNIEIARCLHRAIHRGDL